MSEKVHQLCATIARHPSKINLLNEAITTAITDAHADAYRPLLDLLRKLTADPQLASFLAAKLQAILISLLQTILDRQDRTLLHLLGETYLMADAVQRGEFIRRLLGEVSAQDLVGRLAWPGVVVGDVLEHLGNELESGREVDLGGVGSLLIKLPHLNELQLPEETVPVFKKSKYNSTQIIKDCCCSSWPANQPPVRCCSTCTTAWATACSPN
jgi:hypothetical protein